MKPIAVVNIMTIAAGEQLQRLEDGGYLVVKAVEGPAVHVCSPDPDRIERIATTLLAASVSRDGYCGSEQVGDAFVLAWMLCDRLDGR